MHSSFFVLATTALCASAQSVAASASHTSSVIPLGEKCTPGGTPCANGADCYATNSMLQTVCGNFQSSCKSDQQCAFNTCNLEQGLCNGMLASSSAASASATITSTPTGPGYMPAPSSTVTAAPGSLPLGAQCNPFAKPSQCIEGVQCWASNAGLIAACGNFNAACDNDAQCAFNTCNNGLCNGFKDLSSSVAPGMSTAMPSASGHTGNHTMHPTGSATPTSTGPAQFTGAASAENVAGGIFAIVFGAVVLAF
jgi:hypothetical protein